MLFWLPSLCNITWSLTLCQFIIIPLFLFSGLPTIAFGPLLFHIALNSDGDSNLDHVIPLLRCPRGSHLIQTKTPNPHIDKNAFFPMLCHLSALTLFAASKDLFRYTRCFSSLDLCIFTSTWIFFSWISSGSFSYLKFLIRGTFLTSL